MWLCCSSKNSNKSALSNCYRRSHCMVSKCIHWILFDVKIWRKRIKAKTKQNKKWSVTYNFNLEQRSSSNSSNNKKKTKKNMKNIIIIILFYRENEEKIWNINCFASSFFFLFRFIYISSSSSSRWHCLSLESFASSSFPTGNHNLCLFTEMRNGAHTCVILPNPN